MHDNLVSARHVANAVDDIELRSDTFTMPTKRMLAAMTVARLGNDVYGDDPTVNELEALAADMLGKDSACLMPSGTMANLTALMAQCPRGGKVVVGRESDIYTYEAGGASVCGGILYDPLPNLADGSLDVGALKNSLDVDMTDPQFAVPALVSLETPQNRCGGVPLSLDYLAEVADVTRSANVRLHLDGARLFNAAVALGVEPRMIAEYSHTVQVCLSKGLSAPVGSILAGDSTVISNARRLRKMLGGGMRQAGFIAACGIVALTEMVDRLADDHQNAARLAGALAAVSEVVVENPQPATNIVIFRLVDPGASAESFVSAARRHGVLMEEFGGGRIRAVTHVGVDSGGIDRAAAVIAAAASRPNEAGAGAVRGNTHSQVLLNSEKGRLNT